MQISHIVLLLVLLIPFPLVSQVLTTAETMGKGKQLLFVSENRGFEDGEQYNNYYAMYGRGLTKQFDLYIPVGHNRYSEENQVWVGAGGVLRLFKVEEVSVSLYNILSTPLTKKKQSSTILLNSALIVSRNLKSNLAVYSGINSLVPIGAVEQGFFTPLTKKINVPFGAAISNKNGKWTLFLETDIGKLKALGLGVSRSL